ncbi:MAG: hypothetical protein U0354_00800 [Candidatus Sericytochromatia bacterium]
MSIIYSVILFFINLIFLLIGAEFLGFLISGFISLFLVKTIKKAILSIFLSFIIELIISLIPIIGINLDKNNNNVIYICLLIVLYNLIYLVSGSTIGLGLAIYFRRFLKQEFIN